MIINHETGEEESPNAPYLDVDLSGSAEHQGKGISNKSQPMAPPQVNVAIAMAGRYILESITKKRAPDAPTFEPVSETTQAFKNAEALLKPLFRKCDYRNPEDLDTKVKALIQTQAQDNKLTETFAREVRSEQQRNKIAGEDDRYISLDGYITQVREHIEKIDTDTHPIDAIACTATIELIESMALAADIGRDEQIR